MTSEWERIKNHFEKTAICKHGEKPLVHYDGIPWIECKLGDKCRCKSHDGEGIKLTEFLAGWTQAHSK